jgi:acyl carrier protein
MTWTRESVRSELHALLAQHADDGAAITDKSGLVADLGLDSLGVMEILAEIEDKFEVQVPDEVLREVETVGDVVAQIEARLTAEGRLAG